MNQNKPNFIFLRGLARHQYHWGPLRNIAEDSAEISGASFIDLAGNGTEWERESFINISEFTEDLRARLDVAALKSKPWLVGVSLGGMVALDWAERHADEISGVIVINSSLGRFSAPWERLKPEAYLHLFRIVYADLKLTPFERELEVLRMVSNRELEYKTKWATEFTKYPKTSLANVTRQITAASRFKGSVNPPSVPVLLLSSQADRMVNADCSKQLANFWQVNHETHPWGGHELAFDAPDWVWQKTVNFSSDCLKANSNIMT